MTDSIGFDTIAIADRTAAFVTSSGTCSPAKAVTLQRPGGTARSIPGLGPGTLSFDGRHIASTINESAVQLATIR